LLSRRIFNREVEEVEEERKDILVEKNKNFFDFFFLIDRDSAKALAASSPCTG
jgi:hypothetical protein